MIDYTLSVAALRAALDKLQPEDRVSVNQVRNLAVLRGDTQIGFIEVRGHAEEKPLELFEEDEPKEDK